MAPASITLPANAGGLVFEGSLAGELLLISGLDIRDAFEIWRLDGDRRDTLEVQWQVLDQSLGRLVVFPKGGLEAGGRYEFVSKAWPDEPRTSRGWVFEGGAGTGPPWHQRVVVDVAVNDLDIRQAPSLVVGRVRPVVWPVAAGDSCSRGVRGLLVPLHLLLPPALAPFRDALHFSTEVDGKSWSPSMDLCAPPLPGSSWVGRGLDALLLKCEERRANVSRRSASTVEEGRHEVTMRMVLPGTTIELAASTTVDAYCPTLDGPPAPPLLPRRRSGTATRG